MTEADARDLLRDWPGDSSLEAWIAGLCTVSYKA
jgi:hypothetical protein